MAALVALKGERRGFPATYRIGTLRWEIPDTLEKKSPKVKTYRYT